MSKHTPGPWSLSWIYGALRHINKNVDRDAFWTPEDGEDAESINHPSVYGTNDADLIAAAPETLAALEEALAIILEDYSEASMKNGYWPEMKPRVDRIKFVIAKAKGET